MALKQIKSFSHVAGQLPGSSISDVNNMVRENTMTETLKRQKVSYKRKALLLLNERTKNMGF
jgi:hypothetical protein